MMNYTGYIYSITLSIISFILMGIDKKRAKRNKWRIGEKLLLVVALIGGSPGTLIGMIVFRHKIRNKNFYIGVPIIYILHKAIFILLLN
ncbi:DUF1294 domain-containing protein [Clostridium sp. D2Q-11]|uniref:DUF1294 domain-containing protein n=2 Tax=Anaeromonas frigoriresistens TaxID=2683708 RepID=A0A942Z8Y0_9FIRM|nr:DUF1294 domain-containing protein [Anaeromonas frigoriresistens]